MQTKITAEKLKTEVLKYWRFKRQGYNLCGTEVDTISGRADVMVCDNREIIEIEIKISKSDFMRDFKKKKFSAVCKDDLYSRVYANRLFYCVPAAISESCLLYLEANKLPFGLFSFDGKLTMLKSGKKLKTLNVVIAENIKRKILLRATSELVQLREKGEEH